MGLGKILGSVSPLAGAISGDGVFGNGMAWLEQNTGMGGILPKLANSQRDKRYADEYAAENPQPKYRKGGKVKKMAKGGSVSSASKRGDGCATKGKTKGRFV